MISSVVVVEFCCHVFSSFPLLLLQYLSDFSLYFCGFYSLFFVVVGFFDFVRS